MLLKRHGWRKVMPRSRHTKAASEEAREASKKIRQCVLDSRKNLQPKPSGKVRLMFQDEAGFVESASQNAVGAAPSFSGISLCAWSSGTHRANQDAASLYGIQRRNLQNCESRRFLIFVWKTKSKCVKISKPGVDRQLLS